MKTISNILARFSVAIVFVLAACGTDSNTSESGAEVMGAEGFTQTGLASYYGVGDGTHGNRTASGEIFNAYGLTAAHKTLRLGSCLMVTNLQNNKSLKVRVNDRGPYAGGRILDLSYGAAKILGVVSAGVARVRIEGVSCSSGTSVSSL